MSGGPLLSMGGGPLLSMCGGPLLSIGGGPLLSMCGGPLLSIGGGPFQSKFGSPQFILLSLNPCPGGGLSLKLLGPVSEINIESGGPLSLRRLLKLEPKPPRRSMLRSSRLLSPAPLGGGPFLSK
uniref:Uncharacterized protein n=1 Tax=Cacopsylla melanoneura TaxID=428564 RepID=A0A8D8ZJ22_9HEMI